MKTEDQWQVVEENDRFKLVAVVAHIRNNETGEVRELDVREPFDSEDGPYPDTFNWEGNNFSCDCNRGIFFERAKEDNGILPDIGCGDSKYSVNLQNPVTKKFYYREFS